MTKASLNSGVVFEFGLVFEYAKVSGTRIGHIVSGHFLQARSSTTDDGNSQVLSQTGMTLYSLNCKGVSVGAHYASVCTLVVVRDDELRVRSLGSRQNR